MQSMRTLAHWMKRNGFPHGFINQAYLTPAERAAFEAECAKRGIKTREQMLAERRKKEPAQ